MPREIVLTLALEVAAAAPFWDELSSFVVGRDVAAAELPVLGRVVDLEHEGLPHLVHRPVPFCRRRSGRRFIPPAAGLTAVTSRR